IIWTVEKGKTTIQMTEYRYTFSFSEGFHNRKRVPQLIFYIFDKNKRTAKLNQKLNTSQKSATCIIQIM
ncbi:MAG: hypothetical protein QW707_09495, partial [Candidatus Bathyarchaeia archaeon]